MITLTLDAIANGADLAGLSRAERVALLLRLASVQTRIAVTMADNAPDTAAPSADLVDAPTLAVKLSVPESWIRGEQRANRIPFVRAGRYVRFRASEVEAALAARPATKKK